MLASFLRAYPRQNRTFWIFDPRSTIHDPRPPLYLFVSPKSFHHQFFARTIASGGPPGGLPAASADPRHTPALAARLAQARKKIGAPSLACGAHLLRKEEHSFIHHSLARFVHHYHSYFGGSKNEDLMVIRARRAESSRTRE